MKTTIERLKEEFKAMRDISNRAQWGGGLWSLPVQEQDAYSNHCEEFCRIAKELGMTEFEALQLCDTP